MSEQAKVVGLNQVTLHKKALLEKLYANMAEHAKTFQLAVDGWREETSKALTKATAELIGGENKTWYFEGPPTSHVKDYERVIAMLEMSLDETLTITQAEFSRFALDNWDWKEQFTVLSTNYIGKKGQ